MLNIKTMLVALGLAVTNFMAPIAAEASSVLCFYDPTFHVCSYNTNLTTPDWDHTALVSARLNDYYFTGFILCRLNFEERTKQASWRNDPLMSNYTLQMKRDLAKNFCTGFFSS